MATQTNEQIKTAAGVIKNETVAKANSATRLGTILENMADSLANKSEIPSLASYSTTSQMNSAITAAVNALVEGAPGALDTLNELAAALGDDANFAATVTAALAAKTAKNITIDTKTASYTLTLTDADKIIEMNVGSANNLTVPPNASVAFPIGAQVIISQYGAGQTTIVAGAGVTIRSEESKLNLAAQYAMATLIKRAENEWYLTGGLKA